MPPRKRTPALPAPPVDTLRHPDKRKNIPTGELHDFVAESERAPKTVTFERPLLYPRDPSADPQLVWRGKDVQDEERLAVPSVPIYIQEKVEPKAIVDNVRARSGDAGETLFADFDGLDFGDLVEFYEHDANWSNRLILGDSLLVMTSLSDKEALAGRVQTIYFDPPYGIKFGSNWQVSTRKRDLKDTRAADVTRQPEQIRAFRDTWQDGLHSYLAYLRDRLTAAHVLLSESGSLFLQISVDNVHLVRSVLDEVFGADNFMSLISFASTSGFETRGLARAGDYILWYAKDKPNAKVRQLWLNAPDRASYRWLMLPDGTYRGMTKKEAAGEQPLPEGARLYAPDNIQSQGAASEPQPFKFRGKTYHPGENSHWKASYPVGMERLAQAGRIHVAKTSIRYVRYVDDFPMKLLTNLWTDTGTGNFTDDKLFVVQTNTKVVERCLLMTSDPGDLVLDPTCGSGTTAFVAEQWGRRWITTDTSRVALTLARTRLMSARYPYYLLADSVEGRAKAAEVDGVEAVHDTAPTDDIRQGFVYQKVPRVTLGSIANNPEIKVGMSREEIDESVARHADFELLYDRLHLDPKRSRVAGRFTVESLAPHRVVDPEEERPESEAAGEQDTDESFEQTILEHLVKAGVQNTVKGERLEFERLEPYAGAWLQAAGEYVTADGYTRRVAVTLGPQYGTVGPEQIKEAAKEALKGTGFDILLVCGFAFDARASEIAAEFKPQKGDDTAFAVRQAELKMGRLPVLLVKMNPDLTMGETLLKNTGAGNLFMVFGEPDVDIRPAKAAGQVEVEIHGVDVFDPTTGQVRSRSANDIACWFIDTNYNSESFFVRHAYFTGEGDPYEDLRTSLGADIDKAAWQDLYRTVSMPFSKPKTGRIAVKVINHYGDEVLKVYDLG